MTLHSGARQWRIECPCGRQVAENLRMHSQVSASNLSYFIEEGRVPDSVDESDLRARFEQADGTLVVCNNCGDIKEVSA